MAGSKIKVLIVRSLAGGFRRAGIAFTNEAKRLEADALSDEQIHAIKNEPSLSVQEVEEDAPAKDTAPAKAKK